MNVETANFFLSTYLQTLGLWVVNFLFVYIVVLAFRRITHI